ncbi:hypothetical protein MKW92_043969 [Papaver armeniacum]|nr:hypothetical protein MKW92_043969 [Papaver armeniacum]
MHVPPPPLPVPPLEVPLQPGSVLNCIKYGAPRQVKIICSVLEDGLLYYFVIYINPNAHRRRDEWVWSELLDVESVIPDRTCVSPEELARVKPEDVQMGRIHMRPWYPPSAMYSFERCRRLHVCECCLTYRSSRTQLRRHREECQVRDPPGHEIYIDGNLSIFQIDGAKNKDYCDNLCHLGSMFLDIGISSETIESSMFYVLVVQDDLSYDPDLIAYFSEVKQMMEPYGSSRFLCLPPYQRRGYATLLVRLACELKRGKDAGAFSYYSKYWNWIIVSRALKPLSAQTYEDLSRQTGLPIEDVRTTLFDLRGLEREQRKFKSHFSLYTGIRNEFETGIELHNIETLETGIRDVFHFQTRIALHNTEDLDTEVDGCPEFEVRRVMWPNHQRKKALSYCFCLSCSVYQHLLLRFCKNFITTHES